MKINLKKTKSKRHFILAQYGKTILDLVVSFPDQPDISMAEIGRRAGVSRESVNQWIKTVHGTTQKKKSHHKKEYKPNIIKEYIPEIVEYGYETLRTKLYKIIEFGKIILVRKVSWQKIGNERKHEYLAVLKPKTPNPDLIVIVVNKNERYVIPPIPGISKVAYLTKNDLRPYLNRFDYITSSPDEVPILDAASGKSSYRGVLKNASSFSVSVSVSGERIYLGSYRVEEVAAFVYDKAVLYFCTKRFKTNGLPNEPFEEKELARLIRSFWPNNERRYLGVYKRKNKFRAQIGYKNKSLYLGVFDTEVEAAKAFNKKAVELFGEKANLNKL